MRTNGTCNSSTAPSTGLNGILLLLLLLLLFLCFLKAAYKMTIFHKYKEIFFLAKRIRMSENLAWVRN